MSQEETLSADELRVIKKLISKPILDLAPLDNIYGADYYGTINEIGLSHDKTMSVGTPTKGSINRYYDESRNYSILAPTLDPTHIHNLTKRVRDSIQKNDFSESYFFSSLFDKNDISERYLEKNLIYSKKLEYQRLKAIKERPAFAQLIALNLLILDKLDNILRYNQKHYILNKFEEKPQGINFYTKATFINGAKTTRYEFTDIGKCENMPEAPYHNFPSTELFSLIVRCDSGGPIEIAPNMPEGNLNAYIELKANEEHKIENTSALTKSLNIKASGSNAVVRILGLF